MKETSGIVIEILYVLFVALQSQRFGIFCKAIFNRQMKLRLPMLKTFHRQCDYVRMSSHFKSHTERAKGMKAVILTCQTYIQASV
jgi:hypothetical protein